MGCAEQVSRSLAACQGALLLVDAAQGVQVRPPATLLSIGTTVFFVLQKLFHPKEVLGSDVLGRNYVVLESDWERPVS
jgi:hypothetical protein